jgi:hypothetical protein
MQLKPYRNLRAEGDREQQKTGERGKTAKKMLGGLEKYK